MPFNDQRTPFSLCKQSGFLGFYIGPSSLVRFRGIAKCRASIIVLNISALQFGWRQTSWFGAIAHCNVLLINIELPWSVCRVNVHSLPVHSRYGFVDNDSSTIHDMVCTKVVIRLVWHICLKHVALWWLQIKICCVLKISVHSVKWNKIIRPII